MKNLVKNSGPKSEPEIKVNKTLKAVKKKDSNMEVERGEAVLTSLNFDGFPELYVAGGNKHYNGGTPVNLPENSFIFSDDKSMKIMEENIMEDFGKTPKRSGLTPATIAKQYDINFYRKILADPNTDKMQRDTAEMMIKNYNHQLGKLALVQESKKGFDQGIPFVSIPFLEEMGIDPASFVTGASVDEPTVPTEGGSVQSARKGGMVKIRIKGVSKLQKGGPSNGFAYNDEFYQDYVNRISGTGPGQGLPVNFPEQEGLVPNKQKATGKGSYGRKDWTDAEYFPDFRNRNAWYFEKNPNFNPRDPKQVSDFQKSYNERAASMGMRPYFSSKTGSKYSLDGKFGEVTFSTPNLDYKEPSTINPVAQEVAVTEKMPLVDIPSRKLQQGVKRNENNPFWTQDVVNMLGAQQDYYGIKKRMPWQSGHETFLPDSTFFDPTRELSANAEQSNIASNVLSQFAGPQALNSRLSEVQGRGLENAANILGRYNNLNVGVANNTEMARTDILNKDSQYRADQNTQLYDKTVIANQQFDNSKAQARERMRQSFIQGWTNRGKTQALNSFNKQFRVDPVTGFVEHTGVPDTQGIHPQQTRTIEDHFNTYMNNPNLRSNPELAYKLALKTSGVASEEDDMVSKYMRNYNAALPQ